MLRGCSFPCLRRTWLSPCATPRSLADLHTFKAWIEGGFLSKATASCVNAPSFCKDIRPLFRPKDRNSMLGTKPSFDLWRWEDVYAYREAILNAVRSKRMPCDAPWSQEQVDLLERWISCGAPKGSNCAATLSDREAFYMALNPTSPTFDLGTLRAKMEEWLAASAEQGSEARTSEANGTLYRRYFPYTPKAFHTRMNDIYAQLVHDGEVYRPELDETFRSLDAVRLRIVQMAPFNLIDGAWIANCCPTGPIDELHALLWGILNDEFGMGDANHNHCNLYQELLQSQGIFLPPIESLAFAQSPLFSDGRLYAARVRHCVGAAVARALSRAAGHDAADRVDGAGLGAFGEAASLLGRGRALLPAAHRHRQRGRRPWLPRQARGGAVPGRR